MWGRAHADTAQPDAMAAAANGTAAAEVQPDGNATPERGHPAMAAFSLPPPAAHPLYQGHFKRPQTMALYCR